MTASVGYFEAWGLWFQGQEVKGLSLGGVLPMIVVGRIGKIVTFVAGLVAILDIIGPERVREFAARGMPGSKVADRLFAVLCATLFALLVGVLLEFYPDRRAPALVFIIGVGIITLVTLAPIIVLQIAKGLDSPRKQRVAKWASLILIGLGFHFDLLAS